MYQSDSGNTGQGDGTGPTEAPSEKWVVELEGEVQRGVAVAGGVAYVGTTAGNVYALDVTSGETRWTYDASVGGDTFSVPGCPAIAGGMVYFGGVQNHDGYVFAVDAETGETVWRAGHKEAAASPIVLGGEIYAAYSNEPRYGEVKRLRHVAGDGNDALEGESQEEVLEEIRGAESQELEVEAAWAVEVGDAIEGGIAVSNGRLYFGDNSRRIAALDTETGNEMWSHETGNQVETVPTVLNGTVYAPCEDDRIYAVDAESGDEQWTYRTEEHSYSLAAADGRVYAGGDRLYALNTETGEEAWRFTDATDTFNTPTVDGELVYAANRDGFVYAVDARSGELAWKTRAIAEDNDAYEEGYDLETPPTIADGMLFVGTDEDQLVALE